MRRRPAYEGTARRLGARCPPLSTDGLLGHEGLTLDPFARRTGRVEAFDEHRGYGTVSAEDGTEWFFHCTAIADGTRSIATRTPVTFAVVAGRLGRWEATALEPWTDPSLLGRST
ncbi:MAG: cold shock domain-containing protein [Acidimicrobiales bacterium]